MSEKRMFHRVVLSSSAMLVFDNLQLPALIDDISINGLKLHLTEEDFERAEAISSGTFTVRFCNDANAPSIELTASLLRKENLYKGNVEAACQITRIDIDSFTALRQLIQFHAEAPDVTSSDVSALVDAIYAKASSASFN